MAKYGIKLGDCVMDKTGEFRRPEDCQEPARFNNSLAAAIYIIENNIEGGEWVAL